MARTAGLGWHAGWHVPGRWPPAHIQATDQGSAHSPAGWRVIKDWLEAQIALIDAGMVEAEQVMLPYLIVDETGQTLYQRYLDEGRRAITAS